MDIEETASNKRGGIPPEEREGKRLRPTEEIELPSQLRANILECKKLCGACDLFLLYGALHIVYIDLSCFVNFILILYLNSSI